MILWEDLLMQWPIENRRAFRRLGTLLIVIGVLLAVDSYTELAIVHRLWPLLLTLLGGGFVEIFRRRARKEAPYLFIGVCLIGFSILALICNFTSWGILGTWWPAFIGIPGIGLIAAFLFAGRRKLTLLGGLLLVSLAIGFQLIFNGQPHLWWTILILLGVSAIATERAT